jgi:hypothetical protein
MLPPRRGRPTGDVPPKKITPTQAQWQESQVTPHPIPSDALPEVKALRQQCFFCDGFGHWRPECPRRKAGYTQPVSHWNDWRQVTSNPQHQYSLYALHPGDYGVPPGYKPPTQISHPSHLPLPGASITSVTTVGLAGQSSSNHFNNRCAQAASAWEMSEEELLMVFSAAEDTDPLAL